MLEVEGWNLVLGAIVDGPLAWSSAAEIASAVGSTSDDVTLILYELALNDMVECWEQDAAATWTLTAFAAEGLNVHIEEFGLAHYPRWRENNLERRRPARRGRVSGDDAADAPARVVDPGPGPAEIAEANDELERYWRPRGPFDVDHLPRPKHLLMGCETVWAETDQPNLTRVISKPPAAPAPCRACKGGTLASDTYCLRCKRWGFDGLVHARRRAATKLAEALAG